jgi:alginate O-acetyltransferase complex protein AlgI
MLFNSLSFLIFFPIVFIGYYLLPLRYRTFFLLGASCYFYMSFVPEYVLILFFLITVDYFLAFSISAAEGRKRKLLLLVSILTNIGTLFFFKYFNFLNENISMLGNFLHFNYQPLLLTILLPLGLSFHVFQSLSYVIEVYKGKYSPEKNYFTYALYVMFFPQLVAGPIERPQHLLPQLHIHHRFDGSLARKGLERMLWGFFKKLVIADQLAQVINPLYANLPTESALLAVLMVLFAYQLYCDFSGYSDIAIGSAMMLGFSLAENFDRPFSSRSVGEFWRRWHISLSSWLKDYLYYPLALGWGKASRFKLSLSLFITFALIGLWHGANWTYVVFGAIHGAYLVIESLSVRVRKKITTWLRLEKFPKLHHALQTILVFVLVSFSFIFFRSENMTQAATFIHRLFSFEGEIHLSTLMAALMEHTGRIVFLVTIFSIMVMELVQYFQGKLGTFYIFDKTSKFFRYGSYYFLSTVILLFGYFGAQAFIYFQF